ncbi:protein translocase subunit SecD [Desulfofundulus thermosubterraneus]|uniref:Protein translocase subunit SecD n=1 Tax=Desulfofundulus thermosubterraneus DSM 16057 TaxID=1121432 RepID=A0A1M6H7R8_9FIRM|nr:protein translocase subunit SecD [Desulfofundulus thermosubterraneus]SHJ18252.1 preprotein translocase subunit SecD [Desulfofundulus thermosubterraneus DSM 16057]
MKWNKIFILAGIVVIVALVTVAAVAPVFENNPYLGKYLPLVKDITLGLDLQGGVHVVLEAKDTPEVKVTPDTMKQLMAVIQRRVDQFGVAEPVIQQQGRDRLIVEIAGRIDPEEAVRTMVKTAYLEFKTMDGKTVVTGADLKDAIESKDPTSGQIKVDLTFNAAGAKKFAEATAANVGKPIAIILDGQVLQTPVVQEPIPNGKAQITGYQSLEEAHNIAILLRSGALPVKVEVAEKRGIGPALGADSLEKSKHAGLVGVLAILIFMVMYYRLPGLVADFALLIYALIVLAIYVGLHVTMTLPGIAAFLLSMGIAVDANVIIFERLKEELRTGKSLRSAIDAGFKRAFTAIFDANATTLIAAVVLYFFGTGPIRGFAITLGIGIVASMFTAITVTRWLLHLVAASGLVRNAKAYGA